MGGALSQDEETVDVASWRPEPLSSPYASWIASRCLRRRRGGRETALRSPAESHQPLNCRHACSRFAPALDRAAPPPARMARRGDSVSPSTTPMTAALASSTISKLLRPFAAARPAQSGRAYERAPGAAHARISYA